jgi:DNA-directed RNA polymerase delta subunit
MKSYRSISDVAEEILMNEGTPLHYKEITRRILLIGKCKLEGKTPNETVRSSIGNDPKFIRVAEGIYALREWSNYTKSKFAKDIAYDILLKQGHPMSLEELGAKILQERSFVGKAQQVARNVIRSDKRFYYDETAKMVKLIGW